MRLLLIILAGLAWGQIGLLTADDRAPIQPELLLHREPAQEDPRYQQFLNPGLLPLWKKAFQHPESELHRQAALAVARAHEQGFPGLEQFRPDLLTLLKQEKLHPAARFAAVQALVVLDTRDAAPDLFAVSQKYGQDFRLLIEPTLSRWGFEPIRAVWAERVKSPDTTRRDLNLAIEGLARGQVASSLPDLLRITEDAKRPADIRLNAARGVSALAHEGLEPNALELLARTPSKMLDRLCAVTILTTHRAAPAVEIQQKLAVDSEPAIATVALQTLFENDPALVLPVAEQSLTNRDAHVRRVAIETYLKLATVDRLRTLSAKLNDPHPDLRALVREGFFTHSHDPQFESIVRETTIAVLGGDDWRGQEQASLLLAALDRKEVAPRLVELLRSDRDEVMISTAWALRVLAVPETAPAIVTRLREDSIPTSSSHMGISYQIAHLSEAIAVMKYRPAVDVLRIYIPKNLKYHEIGRAGAIYALGAIFEDAAQDASPEPKSKPGALEQAAELLGLKKKSDAEQVKELGELLMARVRDGSGMPPEFPEVRRLSAMTIGRMRAVSHVAGLKEVIGEKVSTDPVELGIRWAIHHMTGELLPLSYPDPLEVTGWFLEPSLPPIDAVSEK